MFKNYLKASFWLLGLYSALRLCFYLTNRTFFESLTASEITESFVNGLRFDSYLVALSFLVPLVFLMTSKVLNFNWLKKLFNKVGASAFVLGHSFFTLCILVNLEYFKFTKKHLRKDVLLLGSDLKDQSINLMIEYVGLMLGLVVCAVFFAFVYKLLKIKKYKYIIPKGLIIALLCVLCIRGSLSKKPLAIAHAFENKNEKVSILQLNSAFTFLRSKKVTEIPSYFLKKQLVNTKQVAKTPFDIGLQKQNVVFILLESLALEYLNLNNNQESYAPFFSELTKTGAFFKQHFANGRRSIDAIPPLMSATANLTDAPFVKSKYSSNKIFKLPETLKNIGYKTSFFHGTSNNSMYFDSFAYRLGFEKYYGMDNYPHKKEHFNGVWGIYDHNFFEHFKKVIDQEKEPFFSLFFSISAHGPYLMPHEFKGKFKGGPLKVHKMVQYTDWAMKRFFEEAKKSPWFENTLFIITADHAYKSVDPEFQDTLGGSRVPMLWWHPKMNLSTLIDTNQVTQHLDIPASLLDFLNIESTAYPKFGNSIFNTKAGEAYRFQSGHYWYVDKDHFVKVNQNNTQLRQCFAHEKTWQLKEKDCKTIQKDEFFINEKLTPFFTQMRDNQWLN